MFNQGILGDENPLQLLRTVIYMGRITLCIKRRH